MAIARAKLVDLTVTRWYRIFAASRIKLRAIAKQLGVRHLVNLMDCPLR
jgi:hypothetical protein